MQVFTVDDFFDGAPSALRLYQTVDRMARDVGSHEVRVSKSQISFRRRRGRLMKHPTV